MLKAKICIVLLTCLLIQVSAAGFSQTITLQGTKVPFREVLDCIRRQTGYAIAADEEILKIARPVTVTSNNVPVIEFLKTILRDQPLTYTIESETIIFKRLGNSPNRPDNPVAGKRQAAPVDIDVEGRVTDEKGNPLKRATVAVKNTKIVTLTDEDGRFSIKADQGQVIVINYMGYQKEEITVGSEVKTFEIRLKVAEEVMKEVVVTGLYERERGSYTGAATTLSREQLRQASASNIFNAIRSFDPSFQMPDNLQAGSDPNRQQEILIRGGNSLGSLDGGGDASDVFNYTKSPNMPLFILDGFETSQQRINDLDINRILSVTLLKDAAATAIYGSRAANGVVVIETVRPKEGKLRITYTGSVVNEFADLKGYDLLNAREKLELELDGGRYYGLGIPVVQEELDVEYSYRKALVEKGNNTDWLAKPVRNGIGYNNNLYIEGGTEAVTYGLTGVYNYTAGAMKDSDRKNISGNSFLSYRVNNFLFRNDFTINQTNSNNSPYGSFSNYAALNPYWSPYDENGNVSLYLEDIRFIDGKILSQVANPLYDLQLHTVDAQKATSFVNNFYVQWQIKPWLRTSGRLAYSKSNNELDKFLPGTHSSFSSIPAERFYEKGSYTKSYGRNDVLDGTLSFDLNKVIGKNSVFASLGTSLREEKMQSETYTLVGFPNDRQDNILQGSYPRQGEKPLGMEGVNRLLGYFSNISYAYEQRYLIDVSGRLDGSSQFGSDKRFAPFWSVGGGWNVHNEKFLKENPTVNQLKLRYSYGYTGSSNFSSFLGLTTSQYYDGQEYLYQVGTYLLGYGNSNLRWQQTLKQNLGADLTLFNRLQATFDVFHEKTKGSVIAITTAPSTGFTSYMDNMGDVVTKGYEARLNYNIYRNGANRDNVSVFATAMHVENKIVRISNTLEELNKKNAEEYSILPLPRYAEGRSTTAIWAVPSLGIDPSTGKEIFLARDGTKTNVYNPLDQVVVGDTRAKLQGTFGTNLEVKGIGVNLFFEYRLGGDAYNHTIASRVENASILYNVDRRVYEERWRQPGDHTFYKGIVTVEGRTNNEVTYNTSRFVQKDNWMSLRNSSVYYRFSDSVNKKLNVEDTKITFFAGQLFWLSSMKQERGLDYPFARNYTFQINMTF